MGVYDSRQMEDVPEDLREKYFEESGNRCLFRSDLRRCMIFGRHDLIQDAAISRLDLLVCRNTLMYFNAEAQERILARFHFALNRTGYLFLGKAETLRMEESATKRKAPLHMPAGCSTMVPLWLTRTKSPQSRNGRKSADS